MLNSLSPVLVWAATYLLHSTLLLGAVWVWFRFRAPASHALREATWKLAAIGGIITASLQLGMQIESPINQALHAWSTTKVSDPSVVDVEKAPPGVRNAVGFESLTHQATESVNVACEEVHILAEVEQEFPLADEATAVHSELMPVELAHHDTVTVPQDQTLKLKSANAEAANPGILAARLRFSLTLFLAVLEGALIALGVWGLGRMVFEDTRFRQRLKRCHVVEDGIGRQTLQSLLTAAGINRPVTLLMAEDGLEPGACGWMKWQIVVPARALTDLSRKELRALLAHELAHLVRGDQWWLLLGRVLTVALGWQPLNRLAAREWQRASEYLCDAWAIQRNVERLELARCLTTVAEWRLSGTAVLAGLGSENRSHLSQRVERLVEDGSLSDPWQRHGRRQFVLATSALIAVGMVGLAPAATFPTNSNSSPIKTTIDQGDSTSTTTAMGTLGQAAELVEDLPVEDFERHSELIPTETRAVVVVHDLESLPELVAGIELIRQIRTQVSADMRDLIAELDALEHAILQLPQLRQQPLWQSHLQRFRQRMESIHRLHGQMLIPL